MKILLEKRISEEINPFKCLNSESRMNNCRKAFVEYPHETFRLEYSPCRIPGLPEACGIPDLPEEIFPLLVHGSSSVVETGNPYSYELLERKAQHFLINKAIEKSEGRQLIRIADIREDLDYNPDKEEWILTLHGFALYSEENKIKAAA
jgi:hypothetical protein